MAPSLRVIRQAAKRKRQAHAASGSEPPAAPGATSMVERVEPRVLSPRAPEEVGPRVPSSSPPEEAEPRVPSPTPLEGVRSRSPERVRPPRAFSGSPIDLTGSTPEKKAKTLSPLSAASATKRTEPAVDSSRRGPSSHGKAVAVSATERGEDSDSGIKSSSAAKGPAEGFDPSLASLLRQHGSWAGRTMARASVPELMNSLRSHKSKAFFREASIAHLWAWNSFAAMEGLWSIANSAMDQAHEEMSVLQAKAERAEMALEDVRSGIFREVEGSLKAAQAELRRAQEAEAEADAARLRSCARAERAEEALEAAQRQAAHELENAQVAEEKQKEAEEKLKAVEAEAVLLRHSFQSVSAEAEVAEERAENAEEIARLSDAEAARLGAALVEAEHASRRSDAEVAQLRAALIEAEQAARLSDVEVTRLKAAMSEVEAQAGRAAVDAVDNFRKSASYDKELAETTAFAYNGGFQDCKEKVRRIYGLDGIDRLEPDDPSDDEGSASRT